MNVDKPRPDDLPPPNTVRWVVRRKAAVVRAILDGRLARRLALRTYGLSEAELDSWIRDFCGHASPGLRVTRLQTYNPSWSRNT